MTKLFSILWCRKERQKESVDPLKVKLSKLLSLLFTLFFLSDISFIGVNSQGVTEIVSLEPKDDKCRLKTQSPKLGADFMLSDLDGRVHLYDGFQGIYQLSKSGEWEFVTNITKKLSKQGKIFQSNTHKYRLYQLFS